MNQQSKVEARHPELSSAPVAEDMDSEPVLNSIQESSNGALRLDSGVRRNDDSPGAVVIPIHIAKANLAAGPKLLFGMCATKASEEKPEFVFDTRQLAENLGCHPSTISRRKEKLLEKGLIEDTGQKEGRHKIYRLIWDFME